MNNTNTKEQVADSNGAHTKQTAVDNLIERLRYLGYFYNENYDTPQLFQALRQAKEMEKEQIEEAFSKGVDDEYEYHINNLPRKHTETYYNETYGGNK